VFYGEIKNVQNYVGQRRNKTLSKISHPKRAEHNEERHDLYRSSCIVRIGNSRRLQMARDVGQIWETRNECKVLVGKPVGKRPLGTSKRS
jgi:hypothetical protein